MAGDAAGGSFASGAAGADGSAGLGPGGSAPAQCDLGMGTPEAIWTAYQANPSAHPTLPNNSFAGYHDGEAALPSPNGPLIDVRAFGAKGDGTTDDTEAVRKAIDSVTSGGGVVYFPDGSYSLSGPLFVQTDRTVLRGEPRWDTPRFLEVAEDGLCDQSARHQIRLVVGRWTHLVHAQKQEYLRRRSARPHEKI